MRVACGEASCCGQCLFEDYAVGLLFETDVSRMVRIMTD